MRQVENRPETTLFMLMSVDGKISSGDSDRLDADRDWCTIPGVREGLHQYYELEQTTALWSLNTGRVMEKIGVNHREEQPTKTPCSFVIIDNKPHLTEAGVAYLCRWVKRLILVTTNPRHPASRAEEENLHIIFQEKLDLPALLEQLKQDYGVDKLTIQSGGTLNGAFLRQKLFDKVDIVVAPLLVGGRDTPGLIDGASISAAEQLGELGALRLDRCAVLEDSYLHLEYSVLS